VVRRISVRNEEEIEVRGIDAVGCGIDGRFHAVSFSLDRGSRPGADHDDLVVRVAKSLERHRELDVLEVVSQRHGDPAHGTSLLHVPAGGLSTRV
jgi:hypothetical protein